MESKVTVLTPHGRRQNIKITPNTTILQILEEACRKYGFESEKYCLRHHNREVGLTQMFRFSGLPNNCLLEMAESDKRRVAEKVDICIQLEDGFRQLGKFDPTETVWEVIEKLHMEAANDYDNPVVLYMRQEICGKEKLEQTTLKSLGIIEGRALLRFVNKKPEELKTQANVYKAPTEKESRSDLKESASGQNTKNIISAGGASGGFAITKDLVKSLKKDADVVVATVAEASGSGPPGDNGNEDSNKPKYDWGTAKGHSMRNESENTERNQGAGVDDEIETEPEMIVIGERNAILYSLNTTQREIEELPDSFYDLTVNDLKLVLRDLKRIATGNEDAPMLTEKLREMEHNRTMLSKISQFKNCIIRIQFPDRHVLQGVFKPSDTTAHIVEFIKKFMQNPEQKFTLFTIPPKTILPLDKNLLELNLVPTALVHFVWDADSADQTTILKPEFLDKLTSIEGAIYAANKLRLRHRSKSTEERVVDDEQPGPSTGAIPKRPRSDNS